ncbi:MAG: signal peptidase I [Pseudomonadales bacterium]|nr:signal peptidase I [Pseudomonadales bacterium]
MNIDYSLLLFILVLVSGLVWLYDQVFLAGPRRSRVQEFLRLKNLSEADLTAEQAPEEAGKEAAAKAKLLEQIHALQQEPLVVEYAKSFFPVLLLVLLLRSFLFEPFQIPTGSMIPTLKVGDFILVNKYAYGVRLPVIGTKIMDVAEPKRGDIMVFIPPHDPSYFIKRVVGLPGDHVRYEDKVVYINGKAVDQEFVAFLRNETPQVIYLKEQLGDVKHDIYTAPTPRYMGPDYWMQPEGRIVPEGYYFMMGDNRDNSDDSRRWGPVPEANIVGKAIAVWMHKEPGLNLPEFSSSRWLNEQE